MVFQQLSHSAAPKFASTVSVESTHSCGKSSSEGFNAAMASHEMELSSSDWPNRPHPLPPAREKTQSMLLEMLEPRADKNRDSENNPAKY